MLDNNEKSIKDIFDNYEIKLTGDDILTKIKNKKVKRINKPALIFSGLSFVASLFIILVPNMSKPQVMNKKVDQKDYAIELISASNSFDRLLPKEEISKKELFDFDFEDILFSDFKDFESSAFINLNDSNVEYEFKEEENTLYDITYAFKGVLKDNTFNQSYIFYYNLDEDDNMNGVFFHEVLEGIELITIKVNSKVKKIDDEYLLESNYTPQIFGEDLPYIFNVNELDTNTRKYTYTLLEEEVFSYTIVKDEDSINVNYSRFNEDTSSYSMKKVDDSKYNVDFNIYDLIKGNFEVNYNLEENDYEINNINFNF